MEKRENMRGRTSDILSGKSVVCCTLHSMCALTYVRMHMCTDGGMYGGWKDGWGWMGMDGCTDIVVVKVPFASAVQRPTPCKENRSITRSEQKPTPPLDQRH